MTCLGEREGKDVIWEWLETTGRRLASFHFTNSVATSPFRCYLLGHVDPVELRLQQPLDEPLRVLALLFLDGAHVPLEVLRQALIPPVMSAPHRRAKLLDNNGFCLNLTGI